MFRLGLLFIATTSFELWLLLVAGRLIGLPATIGLIFATGFLGAYFTQRQGLKILRDIQLASQQGKLPAFELLEGVCILIAGIVLLTPGFLTDLMGFALLTPFLRKHFIYFLQRKFAQWIDKKNAIIDY